MLKPLVWTQGFPEKNGWFWYKSGLKKRAWVTLLTPDWRKDKYFLEVSKNGYWAGPIPFPKA